MFAKLYETKEHGQILVKLDDGTDDSDAEVRFYVEPPNLGVCSFAAGFKGNEAWDKAEEMFNKMDEAEAVKAIQGFLAMASKFAPKDDE